MKRRTGSAPVQPPRADAAAVATELLPRLPAGGWGGRETPTHWVQFYEADTFPAEDVSRLIGGALGAGAAGVVVATPAHQAALDEQLRERGLDLGRATRQGRFVPLDAADTLARFVQDGVVDAARFTEVIGGVLARAAAAGAGGRVAVFGEMVALLWADGRPAAALQLEHLWNDLARTHTFDLHCAYPLQFFARAADGAALEAICTAHAQVIPAATYTTLGTDEARWRTIALLQHKALALETEVAKLTQAEAALRASEARFRTMADTVPVMVWVADADMRRTYFNKCWLEFTGRPLAAELGDGWTADLHPDDRARYLDAYRAAFATRREFRIDYRLRRHDGDFRWVLSRGVPFFAPDGTFAGFMGSAMDITERVELEERKDAFIALASHELKTPITSLKIFAQLFKRRFERAGDHAMVQQFVRMNTQLDRLTALVHSLLDVSKIQAGKLDYCLEAVAVDALLAEVVDDLQQLSAGHTIVLHAGAGVTIRADRERLGQVLTNLIMNAIKFSPRADRVVVRSTWDAARGEVTISVQDFGIGIPAADRPRIFDRFYQVSRAPLGADPAGLRPGQTDAYPGLGLGLYICAEIVARHGGRLWVDSQVGAGSTFSFTLPAGGADASSQF